MSSYPEMSEMLDAATRLHNDYVELTGHCATLQAKIERLEVALLQKGARLDRAEKLLAELRDELEEHFDVEVEHIIERLGRALEVR